MDFSDDMIDEIFDIFQVESEEIISKFNNNLLILEKNPNDKDAILSLFRDAHSLKGASRMIGLNDVQEMAHKIEDVLGLAKDEKILFNTDVVNILYSAIDFLAEFIKKSIQKRKQIYSENFSKQMAQLDSIKEIADNFKEEVASDDIKSDIFIKNINEINNSIVNLLVLLMKLEEKSSVELIKNFYDESSKLLKLFTDINLYNIKKEFENIVVKLDFTIHASGVLIFDEISELHSTVDNIIELINNSCEFYNIPLIDYYGKVFEKPVSENKIEEVDNESDEKIHNQNIDEPQIVEDVELINIVNENENENKEQILVQLKEKIEKLMSNNYSIEDVKDFINDNKHSFQNTNIEKIFEKILEFFDFSIKNEIRLNDDVYDVINEGIDCCFKIIDKNNESEDTDLILNRLSIVKQVMELSNSETDNELQINPNQEKLKKIADATDVFNTGEIKTLRVDSHKLDELINQINELTIEKIKTKKHLMEISEVNKDFEECQKNLSRVLGFLTYNEKKYATTFETEKGNYNLLLKQLVNIFSAHNKNLQKIDMKINNLYRTVQENDIKLDMSVNNISNMVKNIRILPFGTIFHLFGRMIRDIAQEKGKKIDFEIAGSDVCADKKIIEEIKAPLIHIIRNSIDHGIETPDEREKKGKSCVGQIMLCAYQTNNKVIIEIKDDGRGINLEKIKEKAISKGFLTQEELDSMSEEQITSLIFAPGFSTGDAVTDISGRGIGLDVVQSKITQLNGKVKIVSEFNKGCCTQIILPTTMSILKVFVVKVDNQYFAIPIDSVHTVLRKSNDEIIYRKNKKSIIFENETINLYNLSEILDIQKPEETENKTKNTILILANEEKRVAISIEQLVGEQEVMHKKLSAPFYKLKNISGITTLISGEICLILNIGDIIGSQDIMKDTNIKAKPKLKKKEYRILLVDDSITTITLEKSILTKAGYNVALASNPIEAFKHMEECHFDLIITDFEMPEMDGITFLKKLKANEMYTNIPAIMMSSIFDTEKRKAAIAAGACKYIVKGEFDQDTFQKTIKDAIKF